MPPPGEEENNIEKFEDLFKLQNRAKLGTVTVKGDRITQEKSQEIKKKKDEEVFHELKKEEPEAVEEEVKKLNVSRIKSEQDENLENSLAEAEAAKIQSENQESDWDKSVWQDFAKAVSYENYSERLAAQKRLEEKGINIKKAAAESEEVIKEVVEAINVISEKTKGSDMSVDEAKEKVKNYFNSSEEKKVDKNERPQTKQAEPSGEGDTMPVKKDGEKEEVETYTEKGESKKDIIVLQIHIKKKNINDEILNLIEDKVNSNVMGERAEKKGVKQQRNNVNQKGGVSFSDFTSIAHESGYVLDKVWKRKDTEYVDGELAGEEGVAIGFVFRKRDEGLENEDDKEKEKVLEYFVKNKLYSVDFHLNPDGSTVMSAFGGTDYAFKDGQDKIKRQVFINSDTGVLLNAENKYDYVSIDTEKQDVKEIAKNIWEESLRKNEILTREDFDDLYNAVWLNNIQGKTEEARKRLAEKNIDILSVLKNASNDEAEQIKKDIIIAYEGRPNAKNYYSDEVQKARENLKIRFGSFFDKPEVKSEEAKNEKEDFVWNEETVERYYEGKFGLIDMDEKTYKYIGYERILGDLDQGTLSDPDEKTQQERKEARERLRFIGIDMDKYNLDDTLKNALDYRVLYDGEPWGVFSSKKGAEDHILKVFGVEEKWKKFLDRNKTKTEGLDREKKETKELVWDNEIVKDLGLVSNLNNQQEVIDEAWKRLNMKGFFMKKDKSEDVVVAEALRLIIDEDRKTRFRNDKKEAEKFLKEYFGVVSGEKKGLLEVKKSDEVYKALFGLYEASEPEREKLIRTLESKGVKIKNYLGELEKAGAKDMERFYKHLQSMMKLISMPESKVKSDFSELISYFSNHAALLGIKWYN